MNQENFSKYVPGKITTYQVYAQSTFDVSNYHFVFDRPESSQDYYLVFTSSSSYAAQNGIIDVLVHTTVTKKIMSSEYLLLPIGMIVAAIACLGYGLSSLKRRGPAVESRERQQH